MRIKKRIYANEERMNAERRLRGFPQVLFSLAIFSACIFVSAAQNAFSQSVSVEVAADKTDVVAGESINFQIIVKGTNKVEDPSLGEIDGFSVTYHGIQPANSMSVMLLNGKWVQKNELNSVIRYSLVPQRIGTLTIPSILVRAEGSSLMTDPLRIRVSAATESADYKLRLSLSKNSCYLGEKLYLNLTWYFSTKVGDPVFNAPALDSADLKLLEPVSSGNNDEYIVVRLGTKEARARYKQGSPSTLSIERIVYPKKAGKIEIPSATVQFAGVAGYRKAYDFFGREVREEQYRQFVIPSNSLTLTVLPVPEAGKPASYSGLIGTFTLEAKASPVEVRVGDPITLTLALRGAGNVEEARLPALDEIPALARDFKIPKEMAPGEISAGSKTFTQTLRAARPEVNAIPQVSIPYFDSQSGRYEYARSQAIRIKVSPASRNLTAADFEGGNAGETAREIEAFASGIAHNYEGPDVIADQPYGLFVFGANPLFIFFLVFPVCAYAALVVFTRMYHLSRAPLVSKKVAGALKRLRGICADIAGGKSDSASGIALLQDSMKDYLGLVLELKGASITYADVDGPLDSKGVSEETRKRLREVFEACEAASYAGGAYGPGEASVLASGVLESVAEIERSIK